MPRRGNGACQSSVVPHELLILYDAGQVFSRAGEAMLLWDSSQICRASLPVWLSPRGTVDVVVARRSKPAATCEGAGWVERFQVEERPCLTSLVLQVPRYLGRTGLLPLVRATNLPHARPRHNKEGRSKDKLPFLPSPLPYEHLAVGAAHEQTRRRGVDRDDGPSSTASRLVFQPSRLVRRHIRHAHHRRRAHKGTRQALPRQSGSQATHIPLWANTPSEDTSERLLSNEPPALGHASLCGQISRPAPAA